MINKVSIILPTYNECENLPILINDLTQEFKHSEIKYEIIIVDDYSPDGTWKIAQNIEKERDEVKLIIRKQEKGLASAIKTGIENSTYPIICMMDTDLSHPPKDISRMLEYIGGYDMIWASRYIKGGGMKALGKKKIQKWLSYLFNLYLKVILGIQILDSTNGFLVTKRSVLNLVDLNEVFNGYGDFAFKLLYRLKEKNISMLEIPFTYECRRYGYSKTHLIDISIKYFIESLKLKIIKNP